MGYCKGEQEEVGGHLDHQVDYTEGDLGELFFHVVGINFECNPVCFDLENKKPH